MFGRYYRALSMKHQRVQEEIDREEQSPQPDWARASELKRLRLSIKDQMRSTLEDGREVQPQRSVTSNATRQSRISPISSDT